MHLTNGNNIAVLYVFQITMACSCLFKQEEEKNWLRCWKAMNVTKTGITCLITTEIDALHKKALKQLSPDSKCKNSSAYHVCDDNLRKPYLTNPGLASNSTDKSNLCSSTWEYTKSFINSNGYKDTKSLDDLDLVGQFSIINNCSVFQNCFNFQLKDNTQIFRKVNINTCNNTGLNDAL